MCRKAFTLIEIFLSLFITAVLITILSLVFNTGLRSYRQGKDLLELTRKGQLILGQMTRELAGAMVQSAGGRTHIPFVGNQNSIFFMAPVENSSVLDLCEIGYQLDTSDPLDPELERHFLTYDPNSNARFEYPGRVDYNDPGGLSTFCKGVTVFNLRYHDGTSWVTTYPWSPDNKLPTVVEVSVTIQGKYGNPLQTRTFTVWIYLPNSTNN